MNKKMLVLILLVAFFFSACIEEKTKEIKEYEIELNSYEFDFENGKLNFEVSLKEEALKTSIKVIDKEGALKCLGYFDLNKGKNNASVQCPFIDKINLFLEVTPSDGKTKRFEITVKPGKKITLKKGFKYIYENEFFISEKKEDLNIYITDENSEFFKGIAHTKTQEEEVFDVFLVDKNSFEIYSSGVKKKCSLAFQNILQKEELPAEELNLLLPFWLFYLQRNKDFELNEFLNKKSYTKKEAEIRLMQEIIFNGIQAYEIYGIAGEEIPTLVYVQLESPNIVIYFESYGTVLEFKKETKEEFDMEKYACNGE
ncbi:MAG: hypothetical protein ABH850_00715 [Candidatus Micrarchaeota archaeon]